MVMDMTVTETVDFSYITGWSLGSFACC